ncbi:MAG: DUF4199 domain-containing protein [Flavipsychrobacter sp.]
MDQAVKANVNKQAFLYGIIAAVIYIVLVTVENMLVSNMLVFYGVKILGYALFLLTLGILASQIKKSLGGYMDFRTAFGVIFIMILVADIFYYIYLYMYMLYIDPNFLEKMKEGTLSFMASRNVPQASIDQTAAKFDAQLDQAKHFSLGKNLLSFFSSLVLDALFGLIVAAIVKKNKPAQMA